MKNKGRISKRISNYTLKASLGSGRFGSVYQGEDVNSHRPCAIKMLPSGNSQSGTLENELKIMRKISHENIVKLYDHVFTANKLYLILEYCEGGDLSKLRGISEYQARIYLQQIISALSLLKTHSIVHCDLKPSNVFLSFQDLIKIGDFGYSRKFSSDFFQKAYIDSPLYTAPEILKQISSMREDCAVFSYKADLWSVGCIVYELITGKCLFKLTNSAVSSVYSTLNATDFYDRKYFSPACSDFLTRIFKPNPEDRISFDEFCEHEFVVGWPKIRCSVNIQELDCTSMASCEFTSKEALEFSEVIRKIKGFDKAKHSFLLHTKACMMLRPFLNIPACAEFFKDSLDQAKKYINDYDWGNISLTQIILEIVVSNFEEKSQDFESSASKKDNLKSIMVLLRVLRESDKIKKLKDMIKQELKTS